MKERKKRIMLVVEISEAEHYMLKVMTMVKGCSIKNFVRDRFLEPLKDEARGMKVPEVRV